MGVPPSLALNIGISWPKENHFHYFPAPIFLIFIPLYEKEDDGKYGTHWGN
jgi:hypothetical protein